MQFHLARRTERYAEMAARRALELQPDSLSGMWTLGLALCGLDRRDEAVTVLERAIVLSRAPYYVGLLGFAYGRAGRTVDATRLLIELDERAERGEYVTPLALLVIQLGVGDLAAIRRELERCWNDSTPFSTVKITCGLYLESYRDDPTIGSLLDAWAAPATST